MLKSPGHSSRERSWVQFPAHTLSGSQPECPLLASVGIACQWYTGTCIGKTFLPTKLEQIHL